MTVTTKKWGFSHAAILLAGAALASVVLGGCSESNTTTPAHSESVESKQAVETPATLPAAHPVTGEPLATKQVFTYRALTEPSSLDPQLVEDVNGSYIVRDLFEGLLNSDDTGKLIPGVARRYEVEDNQIWTFFLRDDARWSDEKPVTATDFVYAWRRAVDPGLESPYSWYMGLMAIENVDAILDGDVEPSELGVEALDDTTLRVSLSRPLPHFAQMVTHPTTFPVPAWVIEEQGVDWTRPDNLTGNGAFVLTEHIIDERLVRERNEHYWNNTNTIMDRVETRVIKDADQALALYDAGELDKTDVPAGQYPQLDAKYPEQTHIFPQLCNYYYVFNTRVEPFDDPRVRRALAYAIDRDAIVDSVLRGGQFPAYTFTPALTAEFTPPDVAWAQWTQEERDARAQELMAEAGFGPENPLQTTVLYNTDETHQKVAASVTRRWEEKLAVKASLEDQDWTTFLSARSEGDFEIARGAWCGDYNEASAFLDLMQSRSGYNDADYVSAEYERLILAARILEDPGPNYRAMEELLAVDMPNAPVYHYTDVILLQPEVKGWPFGNIQQTVYSRELYIVDNSIVDN